MFQLKPTFQDLMPDPIFYQPSASLDLFSLLLNSAKEEDKNYRYSIGVCTASHKNDARSLIELRYDIVDKNIQDSFNVDVNIIQDEVRTLHHHMNAISKVYSFSFEITGEFSDVERFVKYLSLKFFCISKKSLKPQSNLERAYFLSKDSKEYIIENKNLKGFLDTINIFSKIYSPSQCKFELSTTCEKFIFSPKISSKTSLFKMLKKLNLSKFEKNTVQVTLNSVAKFTHNFFKDIEAEL